MRKFFLFFLLFGFFGLAPQLTGAAEPSSSSLGRQAATLISQGKPAEAEAILNRALQLDPADITNLYNMACASCLLGKHAQAMDFLRRAAEEGMTDFDAIVRDDDFAAIRETDEFRDFISRRAEYQDRSAGRVLDFFRKEFGPEYLFEQDNLNKFIFVVDSDPKTLESLKSWIVRQTASLNQQIFDRKPDYYIAVLLPNPNDFRIMVPQKGANGIYDPDRHTLVCLKMGQVLTHEFTHALHHADRKGQEHPQWFSEGLAAMYEAGRFEGETLVPSDNYRLSAVQEAARRNALIPLSRLLTMNQKSFVDNATLAYGQSSSLMLYLHEKNLLKGYYQQLKRDIAADPSGAKTLEKSTGRTLAQLEADWKAWMLGRTPPPVNSGPDSAAIGIAFAQQTDGLRVQSVLAGSPAAKAGIRPMDVVVGIDEDEVRDQPSIYAILATREPGDEAVVKIRRDDKYMEITVKLVKKSELK